MAAASADHRGSLRGHDGLGRHFCPTSLSARDSSVEKGTCRSGDPRRRGSGPNERVSLVPGDGSLLDHIHLSQIHVTVSARPTTPITPPDSREGSDSASTGSPSPLSSRAQTPVEPSPPPPPLQPMPTGNSWWARISKKRTKTQPRAEEATKTPPARCGASQSRGPSALDAKRPDDAPSPVDAKATPARAMHTSLTSPGDQADARRNKARRTAYYPPNASRNIDRTRVYMTRGPHYIANWTPLSSLPRHVQLDIESRMVRFTPEGTSRTPPKRASKDKYEQLDAEPTKPIGVAINSQDGDQGEEEREDEHLILAKKAKNYNLRTEAAVEEETDMEEAENEGQEKGEMTSTADKQNPRFHQAVAAIAVTAAACIAWMIRSGRVRRALEGEDEHLAPRAQRAPSIQLGKGLEEWFRLMSDMGISPTSDEDDDENDDEGDDDDDGRYDLFT